MKNINKLGFTLIELLVVITIIGILATGAVSVYSSQIQKARDTTRTTDINTLKTAVESVYQDVAEYPSAKTILSDVSTVKDSIRDYLANIPWDKKNSQTCASSTSTINNYCWYAYKTEADKNWIAKWAYELSIAFENDGNLNNKAVSSSDNWDDNNRYEIWIMKGTSDIVTITKDNSKYWSKNNFKWACSWWVVASLDTDLVIINGTPSTWQNCK